MDEGERDMSILIKGMEMPKSCAECPLKYFYDESVFCEECGYLTYDWDKKLEEGRYENCPLIEIQPHGRLIDADAEISVAIEGKVFKTTISKFILNYTFGEIPQTIIPPEEE